MQYFLIAFAATTIGAIVGIGGGLMIRPVLAGLSIEKGIASFTSSATVFFMTIVNGVLGKKRGGEWHLKSVAVLAAGSIIGAFAGARVLPYISAQIINIVFVFVLIAVLCLVLFLEKIPKCENPKWPLQILAGMITGFLSGLFGIGGGPFQMAALLLLFRMEPKEAALQSTFITFLTSATSLVQYGFNGYFNLTLCVYTIPGGILGGLTGHFISRKLKQNHIRILFCLTVFAVLVNQIYVVATA